MQRTIADPRIRQDASGQVPAHAASAVRRVLCCARIASIDDGGNPVHAGDMQAQIAQSLDNLERVLEEAGFALSDVVRLSCYTTDTSAYWEADQALDVAGLLLQAGCRPVSALLGVAELARPGLLVELEATAIR